MPSLPSPPAIAQEEAAGARPGRPPSERAKSHDAIMQAVYDLLEEQPAREITIEAVAKRAGVGRPTIYKWWPTKSALIWAMFHERFSGELVMPPKASIEESLRGRLRRLVEGFNGVFGKVVTDLIAAGQGDPALLEEIAIHKSDLRRVTMGWVAHGIDTGEFLPGTDPELTIDQLYAPLYYRLLVGLRPVTAEYAERLADQVFGSIRSPNIAIERKTATRRRL